MNVPSRIINVSSETHRGLTINFDDINLEKKYSGMLAYSQSKLANILFTYELVERLQGSGITANCVHPGLVRSNIVRSYGIFSLIWRFNPFFMSPDKAAETSIYVASSPDLIRITGKYFVKKKSIPSSDLSYNTEAQKRLWGLSVELTGLSD